MKNTDQTKAFYEAKGKYTAFLSGLLWPLTGTPDLFQEAMYHALFGVWRHAEKLKGKKSIQTLYRIALSANAVVWQNCELTDADLCVAESAGDIEPFGESRPAFAYSVRKALSELPLDQAQVVVMRYIEKKAFWEIAECLDSPWIDVKHAAELGLRTLKARVHQQPVQLA